MRDLSSTPKINVKASFTQALAEMSRQKMGLVVIVNDTNQVLGILTDGDLRRLIEKQVSISSISLAEAMTPNPRTIPPDLIAEEAIGMMEQHRINHLIVADAEKRLLGALNLHDLFAAKVI